MQNVRTVPHQQFDDIIYVRNKTQQEQSMHTPDPIRVVRIALRLSLAAAFLSAVADRFGWWEAFGQGTWGSMGAFAAYTTSLFRLLLDGY